jgi:hypothetical protein
VMVASKCNNKPMGNVTMKRRRPRNNKTHPQEDDGPSWWWWFHCQSRSCCVQTAMHKGGNTTITHGRYNIITIYCRSNNKQSTWDQKLGDALNLEVMAKERALPRWWFPPSCLDHAVALIDWTRSVHEAPEMVDS